MKYFVILVIVLISFLGLLFYQFFKFNDAKLHLVFCNVGQGDAIFIRTPKGLDILIDGGPDDSVLHCLSKHMPFWDRDLELVISTHPHNDHFAGFLQVFKDYKIRNFATENLGNKTLNYNAFMDLVKSQKIPNRFVLAGDKFTLKDGVSFSIVGPTEEFLNETSPQGFIGESGEFASVETLVRYGKFSALLTGDSQATELGEAASGKGQALRDLSILQVPHHGSRTGLDSELLNILNPKLAVISIGKNNRYGHPAQGILKILGDKDIRILRTDLDGEVEIISDGNSWQAR